MIQPKNRTTERTVEVGVGGDREVGGGGGGGGGNPQLRPFWKRGGGMGWGGRNVLSSQNVSSETQV